MNCGSGRSSTRGTVKIEPGLDFLLRAALDPVLGRGPLSQRVDVRGERGPRCGLDDDAAGVVSAGVAVQGDLSRHYFRFVERNVSFLDVTYGL